MKRELIATTVWVYCVMEEKLRMKLAATSLKPTDRAILSVMVLVRGELDMETTVTLGRLTKVQVLLGQVHPDYMVQTDEQPSPFKLLPSSHKSVIIFPSPQ